MTDTNRVFSYKVPRLLIGRGAIDKVGEEVSKLGKYPLIITDKGIVQSGILNLIENSLKKVSVKYKVFDGCEISAPLPVINACVELIKKEKHDVLIGLGGGSNLDTTKVASVLAIGEDIYKINGLFNLDKRGLPTVLITTTAGTGSECSMGAVWTDVDHDKKVVYTPYIMADLGIIDPITTLNLPPQITADSGIDVLSHALEGYMTWKANPIGDMLAEKAISLVADNLREAYTQGSKNPTARYNMAIAAALGIQALNTAGGGAIHSMAYPVSAKTKVSHAVSMTVVWPAIMDFNLNSNIPKFAKIAQLMGEKVENLSLLDQARKGIASIVKLIQDLNLPIRMRDIGIKKEDIPEFVDYLLKFQRYGLENNPRLINEKDLYKIYENAL